MVEIEFWVNVKIKADEVVAKRYAALNQAGVTKTEIVKRALTKMLSQEPVSLLQDMGLADRLTRPELVELPQYEYTAVPEQDKKSGRG